MKRTKQSFTDHLLSHLPKTMVMPKPLVALFKWLDANGWVGVDREGHPYGILHQSNDAPVGTQLSFHSLAVSYLATFAQAWLPRLPNPTERLAVFARTGGDGSYAALWLDDDGKQHIVHLGSGSGSTFLGVIADDPVDFLRLIAIGYPEICWSEAYDERPTSEDEDMPLTTNKAYQTWLRTKLNVTVPRTASAIVPKPASMDDDVSDDAFNTWMRLQRA